MVKELIAFCCLIMMAMNLFADPQGWHWYNEIIVQKNQNNKDSQNKALQTNTEQNSALEQLHEVQQAYNEAKAKAVLYPTEENIYQYLQLQTTIANQSSRFAMLWPKVLLDHPELDYSINHPTAQLAVQEERTEEQSNKISAIKSMAQAYGLLFFYRGSNPTDEMMAKTLKDFTQAYHIALIPISVDQQISPDLPQTRIDSGQSQALGIRYFPALILVNPATKQIQPLAYGFMAEDMLLDRFLQVSKNFQENW